VINLKVDILMVLKLWVRNLYTCEPFVTQSIELQSMA